jgi:DNA-directed RNA polymerase subunit RPC12/RpoP
MRAAAAGREGRAVAAMVRALKAEGIDSCQRCRRRVILKDRRTVATLSDTGIRPSGTYRVFEKSCGQLRFRLGR